MVGLIAPGIILVEKDNQSIPPLADLFYTSSETVRRGVIGNACALLYLSANNQFLQIGQPEEGKDGAYPVP